MLAPTVAAFGVMFLTDIVLTLVRSLLRVVRFMYLFSQLCLEIDIYLYKERRVLCTYTSLGCCLYSSVKKLHRFCCGYLLFGITFFKCLSLFDADLYA